MRSRLIISDRRMRLLVAAATTLLCLAAYVLTINSGPFWQDAGLYLTGLKLKGGLHPTGYPTWLIGGRLFVGLYQMLFSHHTFARAVNSYAAMCGALAAGLVSLSAMLLLTREFRFFTVPKGHVRETTPLGPLELALGALAGLMMGLGYTLWFQSLNAEVYALHSFFAALILYLILRLGIEGPVEREVTAKQRWLLIGLAVTHGLSCGNHPSAIAFIPVYAYLAWTQRRAFGNRKLVLQVALAWCIAGLLPYAYLPWAAIHYPNTMFSRVTTVRGFLLHVSGAMFTASESAYGFASDRIASTFEGIWEQFFVVGLLGFAVGMGMLWKEQRQFLKFILVFMFANWGLAMYFKSGEYDFWLIVLYLGMTVVASYGLHAIARHFCSMVARRWRWMVVAVLGLAVLGPQLAVNVPLVNRRNYYVPDDFGLNLLRHIPADGILFTISDQECTLGLYMQEVEQIRPDVTIIVYPFLAMDWYADFLRQRFPKLSVPDGKDLTDVKQEALSEAWMAKIIFANLDRHSFYITKRPELELPAPLEWVPAGGLWKLDARKEPVIDLADWDYVYRDDKPFDWPVRKHGQLRVTDRQTGEPVTERSAYVFQVQRFHMQAWKNLGDWDMERGDFQGAQAAYSKVFELDPGVDNVPLLFAMGKALFALNREKEAATYLERVAELTTNLPEVYMYLGQIEAGRGNRSKADYYFKLVREVAPQLWKQNEGSLREAGFIGKTPANP